MQCEMYLRVLHLYKKKKAGSLLVLVNYKFLINIIVVNFLIFFAL